MRQGVYGANNLVGIEEDFKNLLQETAEDREAVTNFTGINMNLKTQVTEYANHLYTKESAMESMQKTIIQLQGEIKP